MALPSSWDIHRPVLLMETLEMLGVKPGGCYVDGTLGLGGHTREILKRSAPDGQVIAFEWDEKAIEQSSRHLQPYQDRLTIIRRNFAEIDMGMAEASIDKVDGIMVDIGLSSLQLDRGERGFSFRKDEPLDMRMDQRREVSAADIVATASEKELADIFYYYGEEIQARRIAGVLVQKRKIEPISSSKQLADLVAQAIPKRFHPPKIHVATKVFQALRIAVNQELSNLATVIRKGTDYLVPGGRFCVISFHSLEDKIAKQKFAAEEKLRVITKKPIVPSETEVGENPRSRSARLRVAERLI